MKRLYTAIVLLVFMGITQTVKAAACSVNDGPFLNIGGNDNPPPSFDVNVNVILSASDKNILLTGANIQCRYSDNNDLDRGKWDAWITTDNAWIPGTIFTSEKSGLLIGGTYYEHVPANIELVKVYNFGGPKTLDVTPFIVARNKPTRPIEIKVGDLLGALNMRLTNFFNNANTRVIVKYYAANSLTLSSSTCAINDNDPIEINFGTVNQSAIGTDPLTTTIRSDRTLTYSCPDVGINTPITITYKGTRSWFDSRLLDMTNRDVGTAMLRQGAAVKVGGAFQTNIINSRGSDDVTFTLVKREGSLPTTGAVTGSGVLVMGLP